jgi:hypothetical protein
MEHPVVLEPSYEEKEILNMIKSMVNVNTDSRMVIHECSQNFTVVNRELVCQICKVKMLDKILEVLPNLDQQKIRILYRDDIESNTNLTATDKPVNVEINDNLLEKEELDEEANSEEANSEEANSEEANSEEANSEEANSEEANSEEANSEESEYSSEEDRDEFSNVEDMNPLNECDTFYNAEHCKAMLGVIIPKIMVVLSLYGAYAGLKRLYIVYNLIVKYGYSELYDYFLQRVSYKTYNKFNRELDNVMYVLSSSPDNIGPVAIEYSKTLITKFLSINIEKEAMLFNKYMKNKRAAYWNKIFISFGVGMIIAYMIALLGTIVLMH